MQVTHSTPDSGDVVYSTVIINIGFCEITHIDVPEVPISSVVDYTVFDVANVWTVTPPFTQVPACGYAISHNIVWTIPDGAPITPDPSDTDRYTIIVESNNGLTDHNTYTLHMQNFVSYQTYTWEPYIEIPVTVTDPCRTSTIAAVTLTSMQVVLGEVAKQYFTEATDSAGDLYGTTVCGQRTYYVEDISSGQESHVVTVHVSDDLSLGDYMLVATSQDEADENFHNLKLEVSFTDYPLTDDPTFPTTSTAFSLLVDQASCDCSLITWDNPEKLYLTTGLMYDPVDTLTLL